MVLDYNQSGQYFGELSLLKDCPRQADVVAKVFYCLYCLRLIAKYCPSIEIVSRDCQGHWKRFYREIQNNTRNLYDDFKSIFYIANYYRLLYVADYSDYEME